MLDYEEIQKIRAIYAKNQNIMKYLRAKNKTTLNSPEIISYSYDLQAGSYLEKLKDAKFRTTRQKIGTKISKIISEFGAQSVLEAGVGEANTLYYVMNSQSSKNCQYFGFDISLSRLLYANKYLSKLQKRNSRLFCSELSNIPLIDNSIDLIYTFHAIEPNHGKEKAILNELLRVARNHLILIEPSYELGSAATKKHIIEHGYCRNIPKIIKQLGHSIQTHELFKFSDRNNEHAITIVEKNKKKTPKEVPQSIFVSPISHKPLFRYKECWYCKDDGYAYPIIHNVPCLLKENAILVSKLSSFK
ncbi:MAG: methyltransferase domain-containing protein [Candidatus Nitrosotenuis sp.]